MIKLSKEFDDKHPLQGWASNWEKTNVPVERVVAYLLEPSLTFSRNTIFRYRMRSVHFQPPIEGERVLLVTDHSALTWQKHMKTQTGD